MKASPWLVLVVLQLPTLNCNFIFAGAHGYSLEPSSLLKVADEIGTSGIVHRKPDPQPKNTEYCLPGPCPENTFRIS
jgi:hypothetical protein